MSRIKAGQIIEQYLEAYRKQSYSELVLKIGAQEIYEVVIEDGEKYQIEFDFFFDDERKKNLRVMGMISFDWATDFSPVVGDFIIAPDGSFIGE